MDIGLGLKTPTPDVIREYIRRFEQNDYAVNTEKAICRLVDAFPGNIQIEDVLLKVTAINRLHQKPGCETRQCLTNFKHLVSLNQDCHLREHNRSVHSFLPDRQICWTNLDRQHNRHYSTRKQKIENATSL